VIWGDSGFLDTVLVTIDVLNSTACPACPALPCPALDECIEAVVASPRLQTRGSGSP